MTATGFDVQTAFMPDGWTAAYARLHGEGRAEFPPAGLFYVLNVVRHASQAAAHGDTERTHAVDDGPDDRAKTPPGSVTPAAVTAAFRAASRGDFGPLQGDVLSDWGLTVPFDLGRAVALLGHAGCLTLQEGDAPEQYGLDTVPFTGDLT